MPIRTAVAKDSSRLDYHLQKAQTALALGDRAEALARFRSVVENDPGHAEARFQAAALSAGFDEIRVAARDLFHLVGMRPAHPEAWNLLGVLFMKNGERDEAKRCFQRAAVIAPGYHLAVQNLKDLRRFPTVRRGVSLVDRETREQLLDRHVATLSVCVLAKNEEKFLGDCLASVADVASEIVVLDTGSTDATVSIARAAGARVSNHTWRDDFSEVRNVLLGLARSEWVLMLDADERLNRQDGPRLLKYLRSGGVDFATIQIESVIAGETVPFRAIRLFRNYPGLSYAGRIHEQLAPSLQAIGPQYGLRGGDAPVRCSHLGYAAEVFLGRGKLERNARLLAAELADNPANAYANMKVGAAHFADGRFEEAMEPLENAWNLTIGALPIDQVAGANSAPNIVAVVEEPATIRIACAVGRGAYDEALQMIEEYGKYAPQTVNTRYLEGVSRWGLRLDGAREALLEAIARSDDAGSTFTLPEIRGATPRYILGAIALSADRVEEAVDWLQQALACDPNCREAVLALADAQYRQGRADLSIKVLAPLVEQDPADIAVWRAGAIHLLSSPGYIEVARAWIDAARAIATNDPVLEKLNEALGQRAAVEVAR